MLVLARRVDQSLMLGDDIEIKILSVDGDTVGSESEPQRVFGLAGTLYRGGDREPHSQPGDQRGYQQVIRLL